MHQPTLRVIKILNALKNAQDGLSAAQLSEICEINLATLYPILRTLKNQKYLDTAGKIYNLGDVFSAQIEQEKLLAMIIFHMNELADELQLGVQLGMLSGKNVIYMHKSDGARKISLLTKKGDVAPAHTSALGKALLLDLPKPELLALLGPKLSAKTPFTITDTAALAGDLAASRARGYTHEYKEFDETFTCFAVPLRRDGRIFASVSASTLVFFLSDAERLRITHALLNFQRKIERELLA